MATTFRTQLKRLGLREALRWLLIKRIGKYSFRWVDELVAKQSLVGDPAFFERQTFPWVADLEADWKAVRQEAELLLKHRDRLPRVQDIQPDQYGISPDNKWKAFVLYGFGYRSHRNCARCPDTARLLERIPGLSSAWFSILAAGKHVPRHAGITKGMVRAHLALVVPREAEKCRMVVEDESRNWVEGECMIFDDSRKHEVWNDTDEERTVLIMDIERPMRLPARLAHRTLQLAMRWSPFARDAVRNQRSWEDEVYGPAERERGFGDASPR